MDSRGAAHFAQRALRPFQRGALLIEFAHRVARVLDLDGLLVAVEFLRLGIGEHALVLLRRCEDGLHSSDTFVARHFSNSSAKCEPFPGIALFDFVSIGLRHSDAEDERAAVRLRK